MRKVTVALAQMVPVLNEVDKNLAAVARLYRDRPPVPGDRSDLNRDLAFLMVDLDFFKAVNDTHGHAVGDRVLAEVGQLLRGTARRDDHVIRMGGEEFLVICQNSDLRATLQAAFVTPVRRRRQSVAFARGLWAEYRKGYELSEEARHADWRL